MPSRAANSERWSGGRAKDHLLGTGAPRQLPYYAGTSYFELDRSGPYWVALARSGGIAIHVAGDVPGLEIECWAIRG